MKLEDLKRVNTYAGLLETARETLTQLTDQTEGATVHGSVTLTFGAKGFPVTVRVQDVQSVDTLLHTAIKETKERIEAFEAALRDLGVDVPEPVA